MARAFWGVFVLLVMLGVRAQDVNMPTKTVEANGNQYTAKFPGYNGVAYLAAKDLAQVLGVGLTLQDDPGLGNAFAVLTQGARVLTVRIASTAYIAARQNDGLELNGQAKTGEAGGYIDEDVWLPLKAVAENLGAKVSDNGNRIDVNLSSAELQNVRKNLSDAGDRVSFELSRDVGFETRLEGNTLLVVFKTSNLGEGNFQVGGKFIKEVPVQAVNNKLEARIRIPDGTGYSTFALPSGDGLPARVVVDVGPGIGQTVPNVAARSVKVVLDAGHGGSDIGVKDGGFAEKNLTLSCAKVIGPRLTARGVNVRYTRQNDVAVKLVERQAASVASDVFVSLHVSRVVGASASGVSLYYLSPDVARSGMVRYGREVLEGKSNDGALKPLLQRFMAAQQESVTMADDVSARLEAEINGLETQVLTGLNALVLHQAPKASVLIELGWLSNETDKARFGDIAAFQALCRSIGDGIATYLSRSYAVAAPPEPGTTTGNKR